MNNQKAKADAGKPRLTLVPSQIIWDVAEVREYGVKKYPNGGPDNWKQVELQRYRDAAYRHFLKYIEDPDSVDEESGIPHYKHWVCNAAFICALEAERHEEMAKGGLYTGYLHVTEEQFNKVFKETPKIPEWHLLYKEDELPEPNIECAWEKCEGCHYGWSDETGDCGCKLDREPYWDDENECWTCDHYKDEMDLIIEASARHYDEQEERGKDRAKGVR